jgi:NitT/TauT family transport system permease protein
MIAASMYLDARTRRSRLRGRTGRTLRGLGTLLVVPVLVAVLWGILAVSLQSLVFPGPIESARGLLVDLGRPEFLSSVGTSVRLLAIAWLSAAVVGGLLGFALGQSAFWARVFQTPLFAFYSIPKVTLYPVFLLLLGLGEPSRIAFAFFHGVFPMVLLVMGATAGIDRRLLRLADALQLTWRQRLLKIVLPALLPTVLMALRVSFGLTFLGLVLAEMFSADVGLGRELVNNVAQVRVDRIAGQIVLIALIALGPVLTMLAVERRMGARTGTR